MAFTPKGIKDADLQNLAVAALKNICAIYLILLELENRQVLQDVMLDACGILSPDPVLGGGPHKSLSTVFILDSTCVTSQVTVDVTQQHQDVAVVALHS